MLKYKLCKVSIWKRSVTHFIRSWRRKQTSLCLCAR